MFAIALYHFKNWAMDKVINPETLPRQVLIDMDCGVQTDSGPRNQDPNPNPNPFHKLGSQYEYEIITSYIWSLIFLGQLSMSNTGMHIFFRWLTCE